MAAVEDLRQEVVRGRELGQPPSEISMRRCLKLLLTQSPRPVGSATGTSADLPLNLSASLSGDAGSRQQPGLAT